MVNSNFTAGVFADAFKRIKVVPKVLHPGINFGLYNNEVNVQDERVKPLMRLESDPLVYGVHGYPDMRMSRSNQRFLLSINRFERKKNVALAVHAFATLRDTCPREYANLRLIIAGKQSQLVPLRIQ